MRGHYDPDDAYHAADEHQQKMDHAMTDRPMTGEERAEALKQAQYTVDYYESRGMARLPLNELRLARALLSTSAAVRGMREALETIQSAYQDQDLNHRDFRVLAGTTATEAINGEQNG